MTRPYSLLAGGMLTGVMLLALVCINPNRFTSIDSGYYLESAANLVAGNGYVIRQNGLLVWNGTFPIGYPALIATLSGLTGLSVLSASKLVNYAAFCLSGLAWKRRLGSQRSIWFLSVWYLSGFLKILAYSWSETVFLVLLAEWVWQLHGFLRVPATGRMAGLSLTGLALFLVRYVGGYLVGLTVFLTILIRVFPDWSQARSGPFFRALMRRRLLAVSGFGLGSMSFYFWLNQLFSGSFWGGERFLPTESGPALFLLFGQALVNEGLLLRDFIPGEANTLAWLGLGIQLLVLGHFRWRVRHWRHQTASIPRLTLLSWLFLVTGVVYGLTLFSLRVFSPFAGPNFRLMAPFTFCVLLAILHWVGNWPTQWQRFLRPYWQLLLLFSWLQLVPQVDFSRKLEQFWAKFVVHYRAKSH